VEDLGKKLCFTLGNGNFHNVSLGQGQEVVAEQAMDTAAGQGHWVVLQVITSTLCMAEECRYSAAPCYGNYKIQ
jgi:hypothetical protein